MTPNEELPNHLYLQENYCSACKTTTHTLSPVTKCAQCHCAITTKEIRLTGVNFLEEHITFKEEE